MWKTLGFDFCLWVLVHCSCLTDHLMVDLEIIIALAAMTYIGESNVYELHPKDEKNSTTLSMKARIFYYTYYRG